MHMGVFTCQMSVFIGHMGVFPCHLGVFTSQSMIATKNEFSVGVEGAAGGRGMGLSMVLFTDAR